MKWMATTIAAAVLTAGLAAPAFAAKNNRHYGNHRDGISQHEAVKQVMRSFDRIDRNYNGKISRKELRKYEKYHGRSGYSHRARFDPYKYNNKKNMITSSNFRKFDRNHDGLIKRKEAKRATKRRFDRADRNGDGYLNKREIKRSGWYDFDSDYDWDRGRGRDWDYDRDHRRRR